MIKFIFILSFISVAECCIDFKNCFDCAQQEDRCQWLEDSNECMIPATPNSLKKKDKNGSSFTKLVRMIRNCAALTQIMAHQFTLSKPAKMVKFLQITFVTTSFILREI